MMFSASTMWPDAFSFRSIAPPWLVPAESPSLVRNARRHQCDGRAVPIFKPRQAAAHPTPVAFTSGADRMRRGPLYLAAAVSLLAVLGIALHAWSRDDPDPPPPPDIVCHAGAYRDANGRLLTLTPSDDGLRYRLESGESGRLTRQADGRWTATSGWADDGPPAAVARIGGCDDTTIEFGLTGETLVPATREAFRIRETKFDSHGVKLAGRLVMPPGDAPVPLAVVLHGSEDYSGRLY